MNGYRIPIYGKKSKLRGEDGYKIISLRMKIETFENLDLLCKETKNTRNGLINQIIEYAIKNYSIIF